MNAGALPFPEGAERQRGPVHMCAFFRDDDEQYRRMLPFASHCADCGASWFLVVDPTLRGERGARLAAASAEAGECNGRSVMLDSWDDTLLREENPPDPDEMLGRLDRTLREGRQSGRARLWGDMDWPLKQPESGDVMVEYESRCNDVLQGHADIVVCAYRVDRYSASLLMDILRAHPWVLDGDEMRPNPMFVPPAKFLADLAQRKAARPGVRSARPAQ